MMNKQLLLLAFLSGVLLVLIAGTISAQKTDKLTYAFGIGPLVPTNSHVNDNLYTTGISAHMKVAYPISDFAFMEFNLSYSRNSLDNDDYLSEVTGDPMTIVGAFGGIKLMLSPNRDTSPYFFEGVGFNLINQPGLASNGTVIMEDTNDSPVSVFFGGGMEMKLTSKLAMYFDVLYSIAYRDNENFEYVMFRTGVNFLRLFKGRY